MKAARAIVKARQAAKMTQEELARRAEIAPEALARIEEGDPTLTVVVLVRIVRALKRTFVIRILTP